MVCKPMNITTRAGKRLPAAIEPAFSYAYHCARYAALSAINAALMHEGAYDQLRADLEEEFADGVSGFVMAAEDYLPLAVKVEDWPSRRELERLRRILLHNARLAGLLDDMLAEERAFLTTPIDLPTVGGRQ